MSRRPKIQAEIDAHLRAGSDEFEGWWELKFTGIGAEGIRCAAQAG